MPISFPHLFLKYTSICGNIPILYNRNLCERPCPAPYHPARRRATRRYRLGRCPRIYGGHAFYVEPPEKKNDEGVPPNLQALSDSAFAAFEKKRQLSRLSPVYTLYGNDARQ